MHQLYVGTCQTDITPELPVILGGMFRKYPVDQVLDPLYASSVAV